MLGSQREEDLNEFKVSLVYVRSFRPTKATKGNSVSKTKKENYVKKFGCGWAGEMVQWLRVLVVLPKDQGSIPSTQWQLTTVCNSNSSGFNSLTKTYMQAKYHMK